MFGYIRIFRQGLDDDEFLRFSAYYCGLCKELGKTSAVSRLGLSYDMTFLAILLAAVLPEEDNIIPCRCMLHPFKKKHKISPSKALSYAADMSILLAYRKLEDDLNDENSIKARCGTLFYTPAFKKVRKRYAKQDEKIAAELSRLSELEKANCQEPDEVADCFAKMCEVVFTPDFITDSDTRKTLSWLGYNIGRWIYLIDALDDLEKDKKSGAYNPMSHCGSDELLTLHEPALTHTLANIAAAYDLLEVYRNDSILKNILYAGLGAMQTKVLNKPEEQDGSI